MPGAKAASGRTACSLITGRDPGLGLIQRVGNAAVRWWCSHHLKEPAPFIAGRQPFPIDAPDHRLVIKHGVVIVLPAKGFPAFMAILGVLPAEEERHRLPTQRRTDVDFLGMTARCSRRRSPSSSKRPIISFGIWVAPTSSSWWPSHSSPGSVQAPRLSSGPG